MNVPAEVNGIAPWEPTVATTVAAADLSRPHPSHPHLGGIRVAEEVLPHPTDLKYPEAPAAPGCPYSPLQLAIRAFRHKGSWRPYLGTYSRIFHCATWLMQLKTFGNVSALVEEAVAIFMQVTAVTPSHHSHIKALQEMGVLPGDQTARTKRMHKGAVQLRHTPGDPGKLPLHERIVLPAAVVLQLINPFFEDPVQEIEDSAFFVVLAVLTGHHLGESWAWFPGFYEPVSTELYYPAFKFHPEASVPVGSVYAVLHAYVEAHRPGWLSGLTPPARRIWPTLPAFGQAVARAMQQHLPAPAPGDENWTHRILRRTYASVLHAIGAPAALVSRQLLHHSDEAIESYVVLYNEGDAQDLKDIFGVRNGLGYTFMPRDYADFMKPTQPRVFVPNTKRSRYT